MFSNKEIAELNKQLAYLKERVDALESNVFIYPTKNIASFLPNSVPINQVVKEIVNHLELDILAIQPTYKKDTASFWYFELKAKQVPPTTSTGEIKWNGGL
jgi:hypothetical protein